MAASHPASVNLAQPIAAVKQQLASAGAATLRHCLTSEVAGKRRATLTAYLQKRIAAVEAAPGRGPGRSPKRHAGVDACSPGVPRPGARTPAVPAEKRMGRYRGVPPSGFLGRLGRALSQRLYLVDSEGLACAAGQGRTFKVSHVVGGGVIQTLLSKFHS
jgi:hypothetical protein